MNAHDEDDEQEPRVVCPYCGEMTLECDIVTIQTARQTHWEPAEYEAFCDQCIPAKYQEDRGRDPDAARDEMLDRKYESGWD